MNDLDNLRKLLDFINEEVDLPRYRVAGILDDIMSQIAELKEDLKTLSTDDE